MKNQNLLAGIFVALVLVGLVSGASADYKNIIDEGYGAHDIAIADLDGDGDMDVIGGGFFSDEYFEHPCWWENVNNSWEKHLFFDTFGEIHTDDDIVMSYIRGVDIENDGNMDIAFGYFLEYYCDDDWPVSGYGNYFENHNNGTWSWRIYDRPTTTIDSDSYFYQIDIDDDNDIDIAYATYYDNSDYYGVGWLENTGTNISNWVQHEINTSGMFYYVYADYIDDDDLLDIITFADVGSNYYELQWYENTGGAFSSIPNVIDTIRYPRELITADLMSSGADYKSEIIISAYNADVDLNSIYFYRFNESSEWVKYLLIGEVYAQEGYRNRMIDSIATGDINSDGKIDIITSSMVYDEVTWWINQIDLPIVSFGRYTFDSNFDGACTVAVGDMDGDGRLDVVASALYDKEVAYWSLSAGGVNITGIAHNAINGTTIEGVNITWTQTWDIIDINATTTTNASGGYIVSGLTAGMQATLTATATGYENYSFSFLPFYDESYTVNCYMLPDNVSYNGSAIYGIVTGETDALDNATVYISSGTGYVLNEMFNSSAYDSWVSLNHSNIISGTELVSNTTDETPFILDIDYSMNYTDGKIKVLPAGNMSNHTTTITNESFAGLNTSYTQLNHTNITTGSEVVFNFTVAEFTNTDNSNYTMDYTDGSIILNTTGDMVNGTYYINYTYNTEYHIDYNYTVSETNTTTNQYGFYMFENLTAGAYNLYASYPGYYDSSLTEVILTEGGYAINNIEMSIMAGLTVIAKDAEELTPISAFTATLSGTTLNTTIGSIIFTNLSVDLYELSVFAVGYYISEKQIYVDKNMSTTVYLERRVEPGGPGVYYPPRLVEFRVQNYYGIPFSDVYVTAVGIEITMGSWDWLKSMFGLDVEAAGEIQNTTMNGTTDSTGSITLLMVETIKYEMTFTKGSEVNETIWIFPKEDHYKIIIGTKWVETKSMWDVLNYSVLVEDIPGNDTHAYINFSFVNLNNATSEVYYFVNQTNGATSFNIYNHTYIDGDCANIANSYTVKRGEVYLIGFVGENDDYGVIKYSILIRIFEKAKRLLEFEGVPDYIYTYVSVGLLMLVGAFFGMLTVSEGGIVVCLEAWILWYIGFFLWNNPLAPLYLTVATVFAILIIFSEKGRQKGVS